jgi:membrane protein
VIKGLSEFIQPIVARRLRKERSLVNTRNRAADRILNSMREPVMVRTVKAAARAWWDDDCARMGASLSFYTLFAIAPILLVATAIAGLVFGAAAVRGEIVGQLDQLVGHEGALAVQSLLEGAAQRRSGAVATVVGGVTFLLASTGAFLELQVAFNTIWRVKPDPKGHAYAFIVDRVRSFGLVVAIGFLLLVSLAVTAALAALNAWLFSFSPANALLWNGISTLVSIVVTTGLFALLFRILPDVRLRWRDVTTGAVVTALLFTVGQQLIGLYLGQSSIATMYGAAGSVMILLLWVYYSCQIVLFGAEFTRVWAARHGVKVKPEEFAVKDPEAVQPKSALIAVR